MDKNAKVDLPSAAELAALDAEDLDAPVEADALLDADSDVANDASEGELKVGEAVVSLAGVARGVLPEAALAARAANPALPDVLAPDTALLTGQDAVLPNLSVGEDHGFAALAIRCLGMGDGTVFDQRASSRVLELQKRSRLEPTGTMTPETWATVLPVLTLDSRGPAVMVLRAILKVPGPPRMDQALFDAVAESVGDSWTGTVTKHVWRALLV